MSDLPLIIRDDANREVAHTPHSQAVKEAALEGAALIGRVSNEVEQAEAVAAQRNIRGALNTWEKAREACKRPVIDFGRKIDAFAASWRRDLELEETRINKLIGDFQTVEQAKARAAEALRVKELAELERKRQAELAQAQTHDERDKINSHHDEVVKHVAPPIEVPKAKGQIVKTEIVIKRMNEFALAKARPDLVRKIEFDMLALKAALRAGDKLPGVEWAEEVVTTVRIPQSQLINV